MALYSGYQGASRCTSGPTAGARALMAWFLGAYSAQGGTNLGIYNCRSVRGGTTTSLHGEGRAADLGINPHGAAYGSALADKLMRNSAELGIQCIIWNRRIWSGSYPTQGFRPYSGVAAHLDHLHVELSWAAANSLTAARVAQVMGGAATAPAPTQSTPQVPEEADVLDNYALAQGRNDFRLIVPTGSASQLISRAWISVVGNGANVSGTIYAQSDTGGIKNFPVSAAFANGHSKRWWTEIPSGTTQLGIVLDAPKGGSVAIEAKPK